MKRHNGCASKLKEYAFPSIDDHQIPPEEFEKEGVLRKDMDVKAATLMEKFGQQGNGTLTMPEFLELQREVIDQTVSDPAQEVHDMQTKMMQQERHLQSMERMVNRRMAAIEDFLGKLGKHMEARGS